MKRNPTRRGVLQLGEIIREGLDAEGITYQELAKRLGEKGYITNISAISRLIGGKVDKPDGMLLLTIAEMGIVKKPSGKPYSFRELTLITCEGINLETGEELPTNRSS